MTELPQLIGSWWQAQNMCRCRGVGPAAGTCSCELMPEVGTPVMCGIFGILCNLYQQK